MDIIHWLARCAAKIRSRGLRWPKPGSSRQSDPQRDRARAARSLRTRLPPHLRRDIGADDG